MTNSSSCHSRPWISIQRLGPVALSLSFLFGTSALADIKTASWTLFDDTRGAMSDVLDGVFQRTGVRIQQGDLLEIENRDLSTSHFVMYTQQAGGLPARETSLRVWTSKVDGTLIQAEAFVDEQYVTSSTHGARLMAVSKLNSLRSGMTSTESSEIARKRIRQNPDDTLMSQVEIKDIWVKGAPVRQVRAKGRRGYHEVQISLVTRKVTQYSYREFPQSERVNPADEYSIPVMTYPIYEEVESNGHILQRVPSELKYVNKTRRIPGADPYAPLRSRQYIDTMYNTLLASTPAGRALGYWSSPYLKGQAELIMSTMPFGSNELSTGSAVLEGRYATININPAAYQEFSGINFTPRGSARFLPYWQPSSSTPGAWELIPMNSLAGKPMESEAEVMGRVARRLPNHDPASYMNDGFDEVQVYSAITTLFDSLHSKGWDDVELSTRPFNAFLYDPDISMRDNAYYTDDTINFTTYSPSASNYARDNPTIWHELGHGVMDRMMGDHIHLADTGGLSEGMADFVAQLVINDVSGGLPFEGSDDFRIINNTGFNLTNEVHDDGEAYGGAMRDMLENALAAFGRVGLDKVVDVTMEAMRLARNHPALTAEDWFGKILLADRMGHAGVRAPGELAPMINAALNGRNFGVGGIKVAKFHVFNVTRNEEINAANPGARENPIRLTLKSTDVVDYDLRLSLENGDAYSFRFPVTIKVFFEKGPLQGAVDWIGENNEPILLTLQNESDVANLHLQARGTCDSINRPDGTCSDYAYIQIWNDGETHKPVAKKRFYLRIKTQD